MPENDHNELEIAHLHAKAVEARVNSIQSQLAVGFTLCEMAKTEINFGEFEQARKLIDKLRFHLSEPHHVPQPATEAHEKLAQLEANIGEVEVLLRQAHTQESPRKS